MTSYEVQRNEDAAALRKRVTELESALTSAVATLAKVTAERDKLRRAYEQLKGHLDLLRRRIFLAQAERIDTEQLELEFAETKAKLNKLKDALGATAAVPSGIPDSQSGVQGAKKLPHGKSPTGRRKLAEEEMPEERVVMDDPSLEGVAERIGFEESYKLGRRPGGPYREGARHVQDDARSRAASVRDGGLAERTNGERTSCPITGGAYSDEKVLFRPAVYATRSGARERRYSLRRQHDVPLCRARRRNVGVHGRRVRERGSRDGILSLDGCDGD